MVSNNRTVSGRRDWEAARRDRGDVRVVEEVLDLMKPAGEDGGGFGGG